MADTGSNSLSSVANAMRLLKVFSAEAPEWGISDLARHLGVAKSTAHRLASTLVAEGFLEKNPSNDRYRLGLLLFSMGTMVRRRMDVAEQSATHLRALADQTHETVHLAVLHDQEILYLRNIESPHAIRPRSYLGVRMPAFCTSEGRAILAYSAPATISHALSSKLQPRTPQTITSKKALMSKLTEVLQLGYAVDNEESEHAMCGVAAPIFDANAQVAAAVGVVGPVHRLGKAQLRKLAPMVTHAAAAISTQLGYEKYTP
jgi:IclR family KDG regulon transcriptional repressor